jgi:polynucleotide 5'-kinase involved in rRNA processing
MGACAVSLTADEIAATKTSHKIDQTMATESKAHSDEIKLLLLGPRESGKSTIVKQMRILYAEGVCKRHM